MIYLPTIVSVGYYFEKKRARATGIAVCGSGFGAIGFPPMATWLTSVTDWRNVNLMYAGLIGLCGVSDSYYTYNSWKLRKIYFQSSRSRQGSSPWEYGRRRIPFCWKILGKFMLFLKLNNIWIGSKGLVIIIQQKGISPKSQWLPLNKLLQHIYTSIPQEQECVRRTCTLCSPICPLEVQYVKH